MLKILGMLALVYVVFHFGIAQPVLRFLAGLLNSLAGF